jgi:hypothetical protein
VLLKRIYNHVGACTCERAQSDRRLTAQPANHRRTLAAFAMKDSYINPCRQDSGLLRLLPFEC